MTDPAGARARQVNFFWADGVNDCGSGLHPALVASAAPLRAQAVPAAEPGRQFPVASGGGGGGGGGYGALAGGGGGGASSADAGGAKVPKWFQK